MCKLQIQCSVSHGLIKLKLIISAKDKMDIILILQFLGLKQVNQCILYD